MPRTRLEVLPVLHAQAGQLVGPDGNPVGEELREVARRFKRSFGAIYHVDLDGLQRNKPDHKLLQELAKSCPVWADCGSRFHTDMMDLMVTGVEQVTLRYQTLHNQDALEKTLQLSEQIALGMEFQGGELVQNNRWPATPAELLDVAEGFQMPLVVVDLDRAGQAEGIERSVAWHARHHGPGAYFAGGVAKQRDLDVLEDLGYHGALVSTALLKGADLDGEEWKGPYPEADEDEAFEDTGLPGGVP